MKNDHRSEKRVAECVADENTHKHGFVVAIDPDDDAKSIAAITEAVMAAMSAATPPGDPRSTNANPRPVRRTE